jgi:transposase
MVWQFEDAEEITVVERRFVVVGHRRQKYLRLTLSTRDRSGRALLAGCGKTRLLMVEPHGLSFTMRATDLKEARMRGDDRQQAAMWSYISPEQRVPDDHPLRPIRAMVDTIVADLSPEFAKLYSPVGRPSIPPEKLLRALLLQVLYSVRSERLLMEQLDYNLLFRWFVGLNLDDPVWAATVFTKNRQRLLDGDIAQAFFERVLAQARHGGLLSDEHFTVDGTLVEAWASLKSFKKKESPGAPPDDPGNPTVDFHGERRSNATHASTTDPEARLFRKGQGQEAKLYYQGHVLMEKPPWPGGGGLRDVGHRLWRAGGRPGDDRRPVPDGTGHPRGRQRV